MVAPPRLLAPSVADVVAASLPPRAEDDAEGMAYADLSGDLDLDRAEFFECSFSSLVLDELVSARTTFVDVAFSSVQAVAWPAAGSIWRNCSVRTGRVGSWDLSAATLRGVLVRGVRFGYVNLRDARLTDVLFEDCVFESVDMPGASSERVSFVDCRCEEIDLRGCTNVDLDLQGLDFAALRSISGARGATISELQLSLVAPLLAAEAGLLVED
ncbi:pentapeptide repeat-containing protein [Branchiibius sp. NY16-3462-2]|uniref:pentapeptide repeat-containing protein n=1 Tax=Branchiibius sp. NY16-3462-2 TaxID=1807500 RepID=UPI00079B34C0|nr:pentapeptide repeat-containing protein [Branchiibius sp. NY16-3462-2]KYH46027.1 hypothetical protein AZH51_10260 [Branchiibius sp. NY16-3462-2]